MAHHYAGYDRSALWGGTEKTTHIGAIQCAIEIIESLDDSNSIVNQEILIGLRGVLKKIRNETDSYKGEF
jgi:hypothetical protein